MLEAPTAGEVLIAGQNCTALDDAARTRIRRIGIGFVYQFHHLLPEFSALENVMMPQLIAGASKASRDGARHGPVDAAWDWRPAWSTGQPNSRAASSSASPLPAPSPTGRLLLLADEPTGNLDPRTAAQVHEELVRLIREEGLGALVATHNHELAAGMSAHRAAGTGPDRRGLT